MLPEEISLHHQSLLHLHFVDNVLLRPVFDAHKPELQGNIHAHQHALRVCARIHNINFRDTADCSLTSFINIHRKLETIRSGHILVGS